MVYIEHLQAYVIFFKLKTELKKRLLHCFMLPRYLKIDLFLHTNLAGNLGSETTIT